MNKTLFAIAVSAIFASCSGNTDTKTSEETIKTASNTDSVNNQSLANDKANEVELNGLSDTLVTKDGSQYVKVDPNKAVADEPAVKESKPVRKKTTASRTRTRTSTASSSSSGTASSGSNGSTETTGATKSEPVYTEPETTTTTTSDAEKKKGWSKAAKGAAIGAGTGAVAGAIISKKKGVGAVVGGLIGAGGGYIIGRKKDKKDGRVDSKIA